MKIKIVEFYANSIKNLEGKLNSEIKGWKITKILKIDVKKSHDLGYKVFLIGEVVK